MQEMTVQQLAERINEGTAPILIDVREPGEYAFAHPRLDESGGFLLDGMGADTVHAGAAKPGMTSKIKR